MKFFVLFLFYVFFNSTIFAQQHLWTTINDGTAKYVPIENVTEEVLEFYDHYKLHYDGSGYSKNGFFRMFEDTRIFTNSDISNWKEMKRKINEIDTTTVIAYKDNLGNGSIVLILCISKENVNLVSFSNNYQINAISNSSYARVKFAKWFKTLLD